MALIVERSKMYVDVPTNTITRDIGDFENDTENCYEAVVVLAKRANQIGLELRDELHEKLSEFNTSIDNLEEVFENSEQIELSKYYERLPKAGLISIHEFLNNKIYHRNPSEEGLEETEE